MAAGGDIAPLEMEDTKKEITVILAGKTGAGKSTLVRRMAGDITKIPPSPKPITESVNKEVIERNEKKLVMYDTPGLTGDEGEKMKALKEWSKKLENENVCIDLLVCCIPVGGSAKFEDDGYPIIMQCLHDAFGSKIWKKCVVAFTYSNIAVLLCGDSNTYLEFIQGYMKCFQNELKKLKVKGIEVKSIFEWEQTKSDQCPGDNIIIAIPAGDMPGDQVLPGIGESWDELMFLHWALKCDMNSIASLIKFRYGYEALKIFLYYAKKVAGPTIGGGIGGGIGFKVGAAVGSIGGPTGTVVGAAVGAGVGTEAASIIRKVMKQMKQRNKEDKKTK